MTIKIFPTLYSLNKNEFENKLNKLKFSKNIHLDFMDGKFTAKKSVEFHLFKKISRLKNNFEVHLMGVKPLQYLSKMKAYNIKKVLIHIEVFQDFEEGNYIIEEFYNNEIEVFLVINPNTNLKILFPYLEINKQKISGVMFMSVNPGEEGQKFLFSVIEKIKKINIAFPKISIQIDGGISDKNITKIISKNVKIDIISIGSNISSSKNPKNSYNKLIDILTKYEIMLKNK